MATSSFYKRFFTKNNKKQQEGRSITLLIRLWREEITHHKARLSVIFCLTLAMSLLTALYPLVIKKAIDMFAAHDRRILYQVPLIVIFVTTLKALSQYGQNISVQKLILLIVRSIQEKLFRHCLDVDIAFLEKESPAQWAARFTTDALSIREALTRSVNAFGDIITVFGLVFSMIWMDWELSLIAVILYPLASIPVQKLGQRVRRSSKGMQEQIGESSALLNESFSLARQVRVYGLEKHEAQRIGVALDYLHHIFFNIAANRARLDPILEVIGGAAIAFVLGFAGWRAAMGGATLGDFTAFIAALFAASRPLRALGSLNTSLQEGLAGIARIFSVLDYKIDSPISHFSERRVASLKERIPDGGGTICFDNVSYSYFDSRNILNGLSFEVKAGEMVGLVGASGSGKSTILSLIPRLYEVKEGKILFENYNIQELSLAALRSEIAYVTQETVLFDLSILENIRLGKMDASEEEIAHLCHDLGLDFIHYLPEGLHMRVGTAGQRLSGGQRQRIALARALLRNPRILLLDEATSALDVENEQKIQEVLSRYRKGKTTLIVAHRLSTIQNADHIMVVEEGAVIEQGTHHSLLHKGGAYARLVGIQSLGAL